MSKTPPYIVQNYIHGENIYVPDDEMETTLMRAVERGKQTVRQRTCEHIFDPWQVFDRLEQRRCRKCFKREYK